MSDNDRRLDISNINSFNRISENDAVEGGHSITASLIIKKMINLETKRYHLKLHRLLVIPQMKICQLKAL